MRLLLEMKVILKQKKEKYLKFFHSDILLQYLKNDYDAFKKYSFENKYMNYKNAFKDSDAFEAQTPKIIEFCGRTIEDFIKRSKFL